MCQDNFGLSEAVAACRSLGYNISSATVIRYFGSGSGTIYLDDVNCTSQSFLQNCSFLYSSADYRRNNCFHDEDVGVDCTVSSHGPIVAFVAKINLTEQTPAVTLSRIQTELGIPANRVLFIRSVSNQTWGYVTFQFTDPSAGDTSPISREMLDSHMYSIDKFGLKAIFGIYELTSNSTRSQRPAGWEFRLSGGTTSYSGRLEVRPNASADWGTRLLGRIRQRCRNSCMPLTRSHNN